MQWNLFGWAAGLGNWVVLWNCCLALARLARSQYIFLFADNIFFLQTIVSLRLERLASRSTGRPDPRRDCLCCYGREFTEKNRLRSTELSAPIYYAQKTHTHMRARLQHARLSVSEKTIRNGNTPHF